MNRLEDKYLLDAFEQFDTIRHGKPINQEWFGNSKNRQVFEQLLLLHTISSDVLKEDHQDVCAAYRNFQQRNVLRKRKRIVFLSSIAALIIIFISVGISNLSPGLEHQETIPTSIASNMISIQIGDKTYTVENLNEKQELIKDVTVHDNKITCQQTKNESVLKHQVCVPKGKKIQVVLPDGSRVWLNSETKLSYPSRFDNQRKVHIEGEGYFEITPSTIPFIVQSGTLQTQVLGTTFNCCYYEKPVVTLIQGKVKLQSSNSKIDLQPGEQGILKENGLLHITQADLDEVMAWKEGKFIFTEENLETIMNRLQRWYQFALFWETDHIKNFYFDLYGEQDESLDEIINRLNSTQRVKISYNNGVVYVTDPR